MSATRPIPPAAFSPVQLVDDKNDKKFAAGDKGDKNLDASDQTTVRPKAQRARRFKFDTGAAL